MLREIVNVNTIPWQLAYSICSWRSCDLIKSSRNATKQTILVRLFSKWKTSLWETYHLCPFQNISIVYFKLPVQPPFVPIFFETDHFHTNLTGTSLVQTAFQSIDPHKEKTTARSIHQWNDSSVNRPSSRELQVGSFSLVLIKQCRFFWEMFIFICDILPLKSIIFFIYVRVRLQISTFMQDNVNYHYNLM